MLRRLSLIDSCPQARESTDRVAAFSRQGAPMRTLLAVLAAALQIFAASPVSADDAMRPNIIYVLADDAGLADFGSFGGRLIQTPSVDRLASEGMRFDRHYAGSTVCAPSRSVLMTGQHSGHTRIRGNARASLQAEDVTVAEVLQAQGYATALIGKWGLGDHASPGAPDRKGFAHFFGYLDQARAHRYYPEFLWRNREKTEYPGNPEVRTHYSHDEMTREALAFIERSQNGPFFLYLAYTIPHAELDVPADSMAPYHDAFDPETPFTWWRHPLDWSAYHYRGQQTPKAAYAGMISRLLAARSRRRAHPGSARGARTGRANHRDVRERQRPRDRRRLSGRLLPRRPSAPRDQARLLRRRHSHPLRDSLAGNGSTRFGDGSPLRLPGHLANFRGARRGAAPR
jgi:hypothetical protein